MTTHTQQWTNALLALVIMTFSLFLIHPQPTSSIVNIIGSILFLDICMPETQSTTHWVKVCGYIATVAFILSILLDLIEIVLNPKLQD